MAKPTTISHKLPEVGLELLYDPDATVPDNLIDIQFDLARDVADFFSLSGLIETLSAKKEFLERSIVAYAGNKIRYIKKRHGRGQKTKTLAIYTDYDIDLAQLHTFFRDIGRPDIYDQTVRRGAPGRFVATCRQEDREEVLADFANVAEKKGVLITPYNSSPFEYFVHMPMLRRLCSEAEIEIRGVRNKRFTFRVYTRDLN